MSSERASLDRDKIRELLAELGRELHPRGIQAQLFVVGGAAMALGFDTRRITTDVDGVFEPKLVIYEDARTVASRHPDLPEDWLNDGVKGLLPGNDQEPRVILEVPGLVVSVPSPRYLLALKVQAARIDRDQDDIRFLAQVCGASTAEEVLSIAEGVIGKARLMRKAQFLVQEMFAPAPTSWDNVFASPGGFAEVLRKARAAAHLSTAELAKAASTSRSAIHAYEAGAREPSVAKAAQLLEVCGLDLSLKPPG